MKNYVISLLKSLLFIFIELIASQLLLGQSVGGAQIAGKVLDTEKEPLAFANVLLNAAADSSLIKVETTDENGIFRLAGIKKGQYWLRVTYVGSRNYSSGIFSVEEGEKKNWPSIILEAIEVITNPPAKYEAEGNAGII